MALLTVRAALIFGLAAVAAALAAALVLKEGRAWPTAVLMGASAFAGAVTFMNEVVS